MDSLTLGQFLYRENLVTYVDILKAKILQRKSSQRLGDIAVKLGLLTTEQVENILHQQNECGITFGQIAIRERYLDDKQVELLLSHQSNNAMDFYDALVAVGALKPEVHAANLQKYERFKTRFGRREDDHWYRASIAGKRIEIDSEGYLRNADDWSEGITEYLAEQEHIKLLDEHWEIIHLIREYYHEYGAAPMPNYIVKTLNSRQGADKYTIKSICALFQSSSLRKVYQLTGIPKPPGRN